jgi:hypothetical protein
MNKTSKNIDLKLHAEHCIDVLNNVKLSLMDSFKE